MQRANRPPPFPRFRGAPKSRGYRGRGILDSNSFPCKLVPLLRYVTIRWREPLKDLLQFVPVSRQLNLCSMIYGNVVLRLRPAVA